MKEDWPREVRPTDNRSPGGFQEPRPQQQLLVSPARTFKQLFTSVEPKNSWASMTPVSQMGNSVEKKIL
ncbi:unnamed protein product [Gulo gulo]|uniref:Uncharacterized protein n=1 Tax=Gulo gulo TaxID=48420 RepID=A0A9X9PW89_GULGU|nr:unnamed protein product [Gulo gulo]